MLNGDSAELSPLSLNKSSTDKGLAGILTGESNCIKDECGVSGPALSLPESLSSDDELIANPFVGGSDVGERYDFPCLLNDRSPGRLCVGVILPKLLDLVRDIATMKENSTNHQLTNTKTLEYNLRCRGISKLFFFLVGNLKLGRSRRLSSVVKEASFFS